MASAPGSCGLAGPRAVWTACPGLGEQLGPPPGQPLSSTHPAAPHLSLARSWSLILEHTQRAPCLSSPCIHLRSAGMSGSHRASLEEGAATASPSVGPAETTLHPPTGRSRVRIPGTRGTRLQERAGGEKQPEAGVPPGGGSASLGNCRERGAKDRNRMDSKLSGWPGPESGLHGHE